VGGSGTNAITLSTTRVLLGLLVSQGSLERATSVVQRHAHGVGFQRIAVSINLSRLTFMYRVSQLGIEAAEARRGVLNRVVITLVKTRIANASQVTHITDLVTEQVGRTTSDLERAVKTAQLHGTEFFAAQTHEGIAGVETE